MLNIIGHKNWYFAFSLLIIIPGLISLALWGLKLSIDFTGGSRLVLQYPQTVNEQKAEQIRSVFEENNVEIVTLQPSDDQVIIRTKPLNEKQSAAILTDLRTTTGDVSQEQFETIGPIIGQETAINALSSIAISSLLIVFYIAWSFRGVRKPVSSWRFGLGAVAALLHDALLVIGVFSLLGHFLGVEVDSLFVTALLTVLGFSVHDTIVVFDRIRENLRRNVEAPFAQVVNDSILQTMVRSLNTSVTALLVLVTLLIFGGETIRWFIVAMIIGLISGTYSSIFNAAPLLVAWQEWADKRRARLKA
ncbi:MAG: protein translocase subunit SecF [Candidatus Levybacteria bacterium]|nr:protein translocase subunit SecF [Candidatus Levybacteria bacterium]